MRLYIPARHGPHSGKETAQRAQQASPRRRLQYDALDRLEPALQTAVQGVVIAWLPVRAMGHELQRIARQLMNETTVATKSIPAAVEQIGIARQALPAIAQGVERGQLYCACAL